MSQNTNDGAIAAEKPRDWPCNDRELHLDLMIDAFCRFRDMPNFETREVLVSLACSHDLNQNFSYGRYRIHVYEGAMLNILYMMSLMHNIASVRSYVYEHIARVTRLHKIVRMMAEEVEKNDVIDAFAGLYPPLKLFYVAYRNYGHENAATSCKSDRMSKSRMNSRRL